MICRRALVSLLVSMLCACGVASNEPGLDASSVAMDASLDAHQAVLPDAFVDVPDAGAPDLDVVDASSDVARFIDASADVYAPPAYDAGDVPPFMVGLSQYTAGILDDAEDLSAEWIRPSVQWDMLEPTIDCVALGLGPVATDASSLEAYAATLNFDEPDEQIAVAISRGFHVLPSVGTGWVRAMPRCLGSPVTPSSLGAAKYIELISRVVRVTVERYDGDGYQDVAGSPRVDVWQIENELNEAMFTAAVGQRAPSGLDAFTSPWRDNTFLLQLLTALADAVHAADPTARVMTNLHASVPAAFDEAFAIPTWDQALVSWAHVLDWIGLDVYPNMVGSTPIMGDAVGAAVAHARSLSAGRPVLIVETGYASGPTSLDFTEENQDAYLNDVFDSCREAGAIGVFWYGTRSTEVGAVLTETQVADYHEFVNIYNDGDPDAILALVAMHPFEDIAALASVGQPFYGLFHTDNSLKPAGQSFVRQTDGD